MKKKLLQIIISLMCATCVFNVVVPVFAETTVEEGDFDEGNTTQKPTQKPSEYKPTGDLKPPKETTTKKPSTTKKPTTTKKATTTRNNETNRPQTTIRKATTTKPATTKKQLPDGSFYVYLEKNNGEDRSYRLMNKEGLVPYPPEPVRDGYVFDGWYADASFITPWSFSTNVAKKGTIIYAKWVADTGTKEYKVYVNKTEGGKISVNPSSAKADEYVVITVEPDAGKRLVAGSITINGEPTDVLSFLMPAGNVVIKATFEDIPEVKTEEDSSSKLLVPFIIGGAVLLVAVAIIIIVAMRRRNFVPEDLIDENGTIIDDDEDFDWDETIVVEDGFKEGVKVEGTVPVEDFDFFPDDE